jgi:WS/DGAT/MGAT family acyltransferase
MSRERFSSVDTVLLRAEDENNPMTITGIMIFGAPFDYEEMRDFLTTRLLQIDRFRKRLAVPRLPWGPFYMEPDPGLDPDYHVRRATLPAPGDQAALQGVVSRLASTPLDLTRPLWQFHLFENYNQGSALIFRVHHSLADGASLVRLLLSMADTERDDLAPDEPQAGQPDAQPGSDQPRLQARRQEARKRMRRAVRLLARAVQIPGLIRKGTEAALDLADLALLPPDTGSVFRGDLGPAKRVDWADPIPLSDIKMIGRRMGGTVNDVLIAAMTGALRRYLEDRGGPADDLELRAAIPVDMRTAVRQHDLGNRIGIVFLPLPLCIFDQTERLAVVKRYMDELKVSVEPRVTYALLQAVGMAPEQVQHELIEFLASKVTTVVTNVKGPQERLSLAGAPLESLMFWVPQAGGVGVGVSILSYAGQVRLGVLVDEGLVPDPEEITSAFRAEFDDLLRVAQEVKETPTIQDLSAKLDDVLATLAAVLDDQAKQPDRPPVDAARCQARTKAGEPCKNRPLPGSRYCRVHQPEPGSE